jgi:hypothetical protein
MDAGTKGLIAGIGVIATATGIGAAYYASLKKKTSPTTCPSPCGSFDTYIQNSDGSQMGATAVSGISGLKPTGVYTTFVDVANCVTQSVEIFSTSGTLDTEWYVTYNGNLYGISSQLCTSSTPPPSCPNSCSADSDCSGCGPDFVCEGGQCVKQIPAIIDVPLSVDLQSITQYTTTCCVYVVTLICKKCNAQYAPGFGTGGFYIYVKDKYGRPIPGVAVAISSSVVNPNLSFFFIVIEDLGTKSTKYQSGATATATTDSLGRIQMNVTAETMPIGWDNIANDNYPCSACSDQNDTGSVGPLSFGQFNFTVLNESGISAITLITDTVTYKGTINEGNGCPCL